MRIRKARQDLVFEDSTLERLDNAHVELQLIAQTFHLQYQRGDTEAVHEGLSKLQVAFDNMNYALSECE